MDPSQGLEKWPKKKSSANCKLKEKVRVSELWISDKCMEDVCEPSKSPLTSFVLGCPSTNASTFSSPQSKKLWQEKLQESLNKAKEKEGRTASTSIQISYWDPSVNRETNSTIKVSNLNTANETIKLILNELKLGTINCESVNEDDLKDYQLWVKTSKEDAAYPLIGHEYPYTIKMNFIRELLQRSDLDLNSLSKFSSDSKCMFILRKNFSRSPNFVDGGKKSKKSRKGALNWPFKRNQIKADLNVNNVPSMVAKSKLFGHPLVLSKDGKMATWIMNMLKQLYVHGPFTVGIFRKSANARICKELKVKLESDPDADLTDVPVLVVASVFKEFLRSLPDCLLQSHLYYKWIEALNVENNCECRDSVGRLLKLLPQQNILLLRYFVCILWHIANRSAENKMCSMNLAVCIAPSLLYNNNLTTPQRCEEASKQVPKVIAYLIDHSPELFGDNTLNMFGKNLDKEISRQDLGADESDSLNSLHDGLGSNASSPGHRLDDSSLDSLERAITEDIVHGNVNGNSNHLFIRQNGKGNQNTFGNKLSLSNLSRDSGVTLSDTQLYNPEDESKSSDDCPVAPYLANKIHPNLTKSVPHLDTAGLDSGINVTLSYGRSVGVSIDGSCHDVVRKRRHQGLMSCDQNGRYKGIALIAYPKDNLSHNHHQPVYYSKSYSSGLDLNDEVDCSKKPYKVANRNGPTRYRHRRPLLHNLLTNQNTILRRTNSEESLSIKFDEKSHIQEPISLPFGDTTDSLTPHETHSSFAQNLNSSTTSPQANGVHLSHNFCSDSSINQKGSLRVKDNAPEIRAKLDASRINSISSASSETDSQRSSVSKQSSQSKHSGSSIRTNPLSISPPSYQETMTRKEIMARLHNSVSSHKLATVTNSAAQIYEKSVEIFKADMQRGNGITHRAIPVRVKCGGTDNGSNQTVKYILNRTTSDFQILSNSQRQCQIRHNNSINLSTNIRINNETSRQGISVLQRSAKDFTEDWRKEVNWSVAQLRTMFNGKDASDDGSCKRSVLMDGNAKINYKTRDMDDSSPSPKTSDAELESQNHSGTKENCVTVIHVSPKRIYRESQLIPQPHKRSDSVGSSEEESYV